MTGLRSYGDACGIARALDVVGERWALLIVRELVFGPKRFSDLRAHLGASPNVLSQRLGELEACGVVHKRRSAGLYDLSDWGRELHPILLQLGRWGTKSPHKPAGEMTIAALMAALEARFQAGRGHVASTTLDLRIGEERFSLHVSGNDLEIMQGSPRKADAVITSDVASLQAMLAGDEEPANVTAEISGDVSKVREFFALFARPS